jgi:hypothetical protein
VGLSDGAVTEVVDGDLNEGEMVITGQTISGANKSAQSTPPGFGNAPRTGGGGPRR